MLNHFFLRIKRNFLKIPFSDVLYIEAAKKYLIIVTLRQKYFVQISMNYAEKILPQNIFCRISKSHLVSLHHISGFDSITVRIDETTRLPFGRQYKKDLIRKLIILDKSKIIGSGKSNKKIENLSYGARKRA